MSAIAALKGYRTQFLYSLHHILSQSDITLKFRLEGFEDLDILDAGNNLLQIIQVKNLSSTLTLSDIFSPLIDRTSFLRRVVEVKKIYPDVNPALVSFGAISRDLVERKVTHDVKHIDTATWEMLMRELTFIEVNEDTIEDEILRMLKDQYPSIDPIPTAEILLKWISVVAEKQEIISRADVFKKIESIAEYLSGRISVLQQYGIYFSPLRQHQNDALEVLRQEFYAGVNARYSHIANNLDVKRHEILSRITEEFQKFNVVILQGASGQGKSTLAYRYAHDYFPNGLTYELTIQDDAENSRQAINTLVQITKSLEATMLLIINVKPDSTEWIKIVRQFSSHARVKFLIAVREEDWYKAQAVGIEFLHADLQISLTKAEAALIYSSLGEIHVDYAHTDFEEAWIKFGETGPLLEFVYFITKGQSLEATLLQQVRNIEKEAQNGKPELLDILRLVCLADSYSASISADALKTIRDASMFISRLENEYLLKISSDKKFVTGLHPLRSGILLEYLFDEFTNSKSDFILKNLNAVQQEDLYHFILRLLDADIIQVTHLLDKRTVKVDLTWTSYFAIFRSLIWAGAREYVNNNKVVLNDAYSKFGDSWTVLTDMYVGNTSNVSGFLNNSDFFNEEIRKTASELNKRLRDKNEVFQYAAHLLKTVPVPRVTPVTQTDWLAFSQVLFWNVHLAQASNTIPIYSEEDYKPLFEKFPLSALSILMQGMYYGDDNTKKTRDSLANIFIERVRTFYQIASIDVTAEDIECHYLIDIYNKSGESESLNDRSVAIISLFRKAFPEKQMFKTQGYGHMLELLNLPFDETFKNIPSSGLPSDEWVDVNVILRKRFEFGKRPDTWMDVYKAVSAWEKKMKDAITKFNGLFGEFYAGRMEYKTLVPLIENSSYSDLFSLLEPKTITDPLGIYYDKQTEVSRSHDKQIEKKLTSKYSQFFKAHRDLRTAMVAFLQFSATALYSILKNVMDHSHPIDEHSKRLSINHLFDALEKVRIFQNQKAIHFAKYDPKVSAAITELDIITAAYAWNRFLGKRFERQSNLPSKALASFAKLKDDFEARLQQQCKTVSKDGLYEVMYHRAYDTLPVITINVKNPAYILLALQDGYYAVKNALGDFEYTSLKYLMLKTNFQQFYFLPTVKNKSLNKYWYPMHLLALREHGFDSVGWHNFVGMPVDSHLQDYLQLSDWTMIIPQINEARTFLECFMKIPLITQHLLDIDRLPDNADATGEALIESHFRKKMGEFQTCFQQVLDYLAEVLKTFPLDEATYQSDELEREYWNALFAIQENIFPVPKGEEEEYTATLNITVMRAWMPRLNICSEKIMLFYFLLCGKIIDRHPPIN